MKYFIQGGEVSKEEFDTRFEKALEKYEPISEYWPQKEDVRKQLTEQRCFEFPKGDYFVEIEEELLDMVYTIEEAQFDAGDNDAVPIAVALWNEGYRRA